MPAWGGLNEEEHMRAWRILVAAILAVVAAFTIGQAPAMADPPGNYAQGNISFRCTAPVTGWTETSGVIDVHYNHNSSHADQPYGTYVTFNVPSGYTTGLGHIDTDVRYYGQSTWHHQDTSYFDLKYGPLTNGWLFDYAASYTVNGGYARWQITYEMTDGTFHSCQVPGGGTSSGTWAVGWPYNRT